VITWTFFMPKITLVVGLPGAGKTSLTRVLSQGQVKVYEDFRNGQVQWERFLGDLRSGTDHVVNDPSLCDPEVRGRIERCLREKIPDIQIAWVFLANDPDQCILNVLSDFWYKKRNDLEARLREIRRLSPIYQIPRGHLALPVGKSRSVFRG
jgi:hypothetical protein